MQKTLTIQTDTANNKFRPQFIKLSAKSPRFNRDRLFLRPVTQSFVSKTGIRLDSSSIPNFPVLSSMSPKVENTPVMSSVRFASSHQEAFAQWLAESRPFHYTSKKSQKSLAFPEENRHMHRRMEIEAQNYNLNTLELSAIGKNDETINFRERQNPLSIHRMSIVANLGSQTERARIKSRPTASLSKAILPKSVVTLKPFSPNAHGNIFNIVKQQSELPELSLSGSATTRNHIIRREQKFFDVEAFSRKFKEIKEVEEKKGSMSPRGKKCMLHEIEPRSVQVSSLKRGGGGDERATPKNQESSINFQVFSRKNSTTSTNNNNNKPVTDRLRISIKEDNLLEGQGNLNFLSVLPFSPTQNKNYISNYEIKRKQRKLEKESRKRNNFVI